ncbi:hypothetical protein [Escherichia coli]|uniref:hypothetical protein n=1 Tax=Escherichia coli TaxID=562 RepID=UPI001594CFCB|nr:hypothetical protein [Escherichia coli]
MRDPRETLARIRAQADAALEGPWEAKSETPTMSGAVWNLRIVGKPGIRMNVTEWQHGMESAEFIAASRTNVPRLVDALDAVLELHKPIQASMTNSNGGVTDVTVCDHCLDPTYPCPTVAAITRALEGETCD